MGRLLILRLIPLVLSFIWGGGVLAAAVAAQSTSAGVEPASSEPAAEPDEVRFGIVIRLSEQLFQIRRQAVSRTDPIREVIVGVCNIGTAQTTGELVPDLRPRNHGVAMDLNFRGTTVSRTQARQSFARICSTSTSRVDVTTPIAFQLETGFIAGTSTSHATLVNVCRNVTAELPGLRGHLVRKVALNRIREQQQQIRCESERATRRHIEEDARLEVDAQLRIWNAHWEPLRQLLVAQSWFEQDRAVEYASDERHLILYIRGNPPIAADAVPPPRILFPPKSLPDPVPNGLVDVIFYTDESQKPAVTGLLKLIESVIDEYAADQPVADRLSFATNAGSDWVKLSVGLDAEGVKENPPTTKESSERP